MYKLRIAYLIGCFILCFGSCMPPMTAHAAVRMASGPTYHQNFFQIISVDASSGEIESPKQKTLLMAQAPNSTARKTTSQKSNAANGGRRGNGNPPAPNAANGAASGNTLTTLPNRSLNAISQGSRTGSNASTGSSSTQSAASLPPFGGNPNVQLLPQNRAATGQRSGNYNAFPAEPLSGTPNTQSPASLPPFGGNPNVQISPQNRAAASGQRTGNYTAPPAAPVGQSSGNYVAPPAAPSGQPTGVRRNVAAINQAIAGSRTGSNASTGTSNTLNTASIPPWGGSPNALIAQRPVAANAQGRQARQYLLAPAAPNNAQSVTRPLRVYEFNFIANRAGTSRPAPIKRAKINTQKNAKKVFDGPVVQPFKAANNQITNVNTGANTKDAAFQNWAAKQFGARLGGGANAQAFRDAHNPNVVHKVVRLTTNELGQTNESTITDQLGGQAILQLARAEIRSEGRALRKRRHALFSVVSSDAPKVYKVSGGNGVADQYFAVSRSQNIASPVYAANGARLGGVATNARERIQKRGLNSEGKQGLTSKEELTINLVVRRLNNKGIVWTDHKLKNLDVVKDKTSPTGHRVVLFDFDGFRPISGVTRADRREKARKIQKQLDNIKRRQSDREPLRTLSGENIDLGSFDMTAFDNSVRGFMFTAEANRDRADYLSYNNMSAQQLRDATNQQFNDYDLTVSIQ